MSDQDLPIILIVDDQPENLAVLSGLLQPQYRVLAARSGEQALRAATRTPLPDLVLLDVMMPEMDGYAVLAHWRDNLATADIPVIFITALSAVEDEQRGFELGAVDYITKPIKPATVLARVRTHLELKQARDRLADQNDMLENHVALRTEELNQALVREESAHASLKQTYANTLLAIGELAGLRSGALADHSRRVADLTRKVAFRMDMTSDEVQDIFVAALLHDVGKIGFPDALLNKPVNVLRGDELAAYRRHPIVGAEVIKRITALSRIASLIRSHHELYNGTGYPDGLVGLGIPIGARIICAVNDYEDLKNGTMTAQRMSAKEACEYLVFGKGTRYDPTVIQELEPILAAEGKFEIKEILVSVTHMHEGMQLTRDVLHNDGYLLLSKGTVVNRRLIDQLVAVEKQAGASLQVYVDRASCLGTA